MTSHLQSPPSTDKVLAAVRGQLSTRKRWLYRLLLVVDVAVVAVVGALWITEPGPLPLTLHIAFGAMLVIGCSWVVVFNWILWRRKSVSVVDEVLTSWTAMIASALFIIIALPIAVGRGQIAAAIGLAATGVAFFASSGWMLIRARRMQKQLLDRLQQIEANATGSRS